ncbi:MAG TPA: class I SAM-dependent rRNA methyltransferase [Candidatus Binataceae bacterium]|nr:class I SAM-dependent rRNA methyltransferase [Candidatus Binataceae bacterium]
MNKAGEGVATAGRIYLRAGRDGPVRGGNPWIFSQAIGRIEPATLEAGALAEVYDAGGDLIGAGYYNPRTTIAIRIIAWGETRPLPEIVAGRIDGAIRLRRQFVRDDTDSYRLINGDGDGLSGVVVDRYGDVLMVQLLTAGADRMRELLAPALAARLAPRAIIERSQGAVRKQEDLPDSAGVLIGEAVAETVGRENGIKFVADLARGQKTGAFLDQRENHALAGALASGARVLDACCYGGGFALAALKGGAKRVVAIDTSARALALLSRNLELNGYDAAAVSPFHGEASEFMAKTEERFDLVVLDPPPLARSRADAERAGRLYADLNAFAMKVLAPGGRILTFSCSAHFRGDDFVHAVRIAQSKARRNLRILAHLGPGPDHPCLLGHIEGEYLTGLLLADL